MQIFIYDPNFPGRTMTLRPNVAGAMCGYDEVPSERWRSYFVQTRYRSATPPFVAANPTEIIVEIQTGGDDLRGGNDSVHLVVLLQNGTVLRFNNVNDFPGQSLVIAEILAGVGFLCGVTAYILHRPAARQAVWAGIRRHEI